MKILIYVLQIFERKRTNFFFIKKNKKRGTNDIFNMLINFILIKEKYCRNKGDLLNLTRQSDIGEWLNHLI